MSSDDQPSEAAEDAAARIHECAALLKEGDAEQALRCFQALVDGYAQAAEPEIGQQTRRAFAGKGAALLRLGRLVDAEEAFAAVQISAEETLDPAVLGAAQRAIARLLLSRVRTLHRERNFAEAVAVADVLLASYADALPEEQLELVAEARMLRSSALAGQGRNHEAISEFDALLGQYMKVEMPAVRKVLANALDRKGQLLAAIGETTRAAESYEQLLLRFGEGGEDFAPFIANALLGKLKIMESAERFEDAVKVLDELIRRFDHDPPKRRPRVAINARLEKKDLLRELGRRSDAIAVCDELVGRYSDVADTEVRFRVAIALADKAGLLIEDDRLEEALAALDDLGERFEHDDEEKLQGPLTRGLGSKAAALERLGHWESALAVDQQLIDRYRQVHDPEIEARVAKALCRRAVALHEHGRIDESLDAWTAVIERYLGADAQALRNLLGRALGGKLELLWLTGRTDEMGPLVELMLKEVRFEDDDGDLQLARALSFQVAMLADSEQFADAIDAADAMVARFPEPSDPGLRRQIAQTMSNKVLALSSLGRYEDAESTQQELLALFGEDALEIFTEHAQHAGEVKGARAEAQHAASLYSRAWFLNGLGRSPEALIVLSGLLESYETTQEESIATVVDGARALREEIASGEPDN